MTEPSSDLELRQRLQQLEASDARLHTELAAAAAREVALAQIAQRINEHPLDVDGTLRAIAEAARVLTGGDAARVFLRDGGQLVGNLGAIDGESVPARYLAAIGVRSSMAAPLGRAEPIAGSLAVARNQVRPFNATEMATLEAFAAQAAIAIETARGSTFTVTLPVACVQVDGAS